MGFSVSTLYVLSIASILGADYPEAKLSNQRLQVRIFLPDAKSGFYKGLRFDWSGVIGSLKFQGHNFYGPWFTRVDPGVRDFVYKDGDIVASPASAATGPAEEFQLPLGYDTAKPGETFVKVGVGILRKPDDSAYSPYKLYELVDSGKWTVNRTPDSVEFVQTLGTAISDYAYIYRKTIRLANDKPEMLMQHALKNTGRLPIRTILYNHNFLVLDHLSTGPDLTITLPYEIKSTRAPDSKFAETQGKQLKYVSKLENQDRVTAGLQGFGTDPADYDFRIESSKARVGVRIRGDRPLNNASLWSIRSVMAVEPFIDIAADAGKEFTWNYTYDYYSTAGQ
jgi:hypothetical protein